MTEWNLYRFNFGKNCDKKDKKNTEIYLQMCRVMQRIIKKLNLLPLFIFLYRLVNHVMPK